jgi:hypothetical protein
VASIEATRLAQHVLDLEDEAARERDALQGYDRISVNSGIPLSVPLFDVIGTDVARALRPVDSTPWLAALDQLMADPTAEVSIPIPSRRPAPVLRYSHEVRHSIPLRRLEPEATEAESVETIIPEPTSAEA